MKRFVFSLLILTIFATFSMAQEILPSVDVKTLDGATFNTKEIQNDGNPIIICFWTTWCGPCRDFLQAMSNEYYDKWRKETGMKLYAVAIDDSKTASRVAPFVKGRKWNFEVLQDENSDLKHAMYVLDVPEIFILNGKGQVVWKHVGYEPDVPEDMEKELLKWKKK